MQVKQLAKNLVVDRVPYHRCVLTCCQENGVNLLNINACFLLAFPVRYLCNEK